MVRLHPVSPKEGGAVGRGPTGRAQPSGGGVNLPGAESTFRGRAQPSRGGVNLRAGGGAGLGFCARIQDPTDSEISGPPREDGMARVMHHNLVNHPLVGKVTFATTMTKYQYTCNIKSLEKSRKRKDG